MTTMFFSIIFEKKTSRTFINFFLFFILLSSKSFAWQHEIAGGYGSSKEIRKDYTNSGYVITAKFYKFPPVDKTLIFTIDGTLAHWHSSTLNHNQLTTAAIAPSARAYFFNFSTGGIHPYLGISFGPNYLSEKRLGTQDQGSHFSFQTTVEAGTEVGSQKHSIDLNMHLAHYCNAGLFRPNAGLNILYIFTIGYQF